MGNGPLILDGAMGTALMARGLSGGAPAEAWNLERPDVVLEIHASYYEAGSDVVQTNTFGGSPIALARHGLAQRMDRINREAARLAREAASRVTATDALATATQPRLVAGNIGPSGRFLPPVGDAKPEQLRESFAAQAAALATGGVDYISIETMGDLNEALCALGAAREATGLPVTVCLTFERKKRGFFTIMGNRPADCAQALGDAGAAAVGANCSIASAAMVDLCAELVAVSDVPVVVKPNAGAPEVTPTGPVYRQEPASFAGDAVAMVNRGARSVGGCCGCDARFIAALRDALARP
jgi:methionine synthase I (cobalamin-dependent)